VPVPIAVDALGMTASQGSDHPCGPAEAGPSSAQGPRRPVRSAELLPYLATAVAGTRLPERPDRDAVDALLVAVRERNLG
jgi:hypothetical protein